MMLPFMKKPFHAWSSPDVWAVQVAAGDNVELGVHPVEPLHHQVQRQPVGPHHHPRRHYHLVRGSIFKLSKGILWLFQFQNRFSGLEAYTKDIISFPHNI